MLVLFVLTFSNMLENKGEKLVSGKQNGPEEHNGIILLMTSLNHHRRDPQVVTDREREGRKEVEHGVQDVEGINKSSQGMADSVKQN